MSQGEDKKKLNRLQRFLYWIDIQPYTIQVFYNKKHQYSSRTGGCISAIFILATVTVFIINAIYLCNQNSMDFDQIQIKNDFNTPVELKSDSIWMALYGISDNNTYFNMNSTQIQSNGLQVMVSQTNRSNTSHTIPKQKNINNSDFLFTFPTNFNLSLYGRRDVIIQNEEQFRQFRELGLCVVLNNSSKFQQKGLIVKIFMEINITYPDQPIFQSQKNKKTRIFQFREGYPILFDQTEKLYLYFRRYQVKTDKNYLFPLGFPLINNPDPQNYIHFNEQFRTMQTPRLNLSDLSEVDQNKIIAQVKFKRSIYSVKYTRYYKKIPQYLSQCFSVAGAIFFILMLTYAGYNRWRFLKQNQRNQQAVQQNKYGQQNNQQESINLINYYGSLLKLLLRIGKQIKQNKTMTTMFEQNMDIKEINRRINDLQQQNQNKTIKGQKKQKNKIQVKSSIALIDTSKQSLLQQKP